MLEFFAQATTDFPVVGSAVGGGAIGLGGILFMLRTIMTRLEERRKDDVEHFKSINSLTTDVRVLQKTVSNGLSDDIKEIKDNVKALGTKLDTSIDKMNNTLAECQRRNT